MFRFCLQLSNFSNCLAGSSNLSSTSSIQAAVRQLEAEADAIIQMVREGQRARRLQQAAPPSSSSSATSSAAASGPSVAPGHVPSTAASNNPPASSASSATVSMGRIYSRHTATAILILRTMLCGTWRETNN